jgi:hypothetical protein
VAVVINEFEVVDAPQDARSPGDTHATAASPQELDAEDLRRAMAELLEQQLRLWAH